MATGNYSIPETVYSETEKSPKISHFQQIENFGKSGFEKSQFQFLGFDLRNLDPSFPNCWYSHSENFKARFNFGKPKNFGNAGNIMVPENRKKSRKSGNQIKTGKLAYSGKYGKSHEIRLKFYGFRKPRFCFPCDPFDVSSMSPYNSVYK